MKKCFVIRSNLKEFTRGENAIRLETNNKVNKTIPPCWRQQLGDGNQLRNRDLGLGRECWCAGCLRMVHLGNRSTTRPMFPAVGMASQKTQIGHFLCPLDGRQCRLRAEASLSLGLVCL